MSDSKELRRIVETMTERPWNYGPDNDPNNGDIEDADKYVARVNRMPVAGNTIGITTLANHASALVKLVEACERFAEHHVVCNPDPRQILTALAAVHATKGTP